LTSTELSVSQTWKAPERHPVRAVSLDAREAPPWAPATGARRIAVVGLGYVGLPTALALHQPGVEVIGIDISQRRLTAIAEGAVDLLEADRRRLAEALRSAAFVITGRAEALQEADVVIVCVPTPVDDHQTPELVPLRAACESVVRSARPGQVLILTSTTYVGSTRDLLIDPLTRSGLAVGSDVHVAFSPERIDPGNADHTQERVPRVIGGASPACSRQAAEVIARITPTVHLVGSPEAAEMTKLYENTFRAVNIALVNELADISRRFALDVMEIIQAASTKPYGFMPFYPGPGVGGHCIPCDPHYLLWQLRAQRASAPVIGRAMEEIAARPARVVDRAAQVLAEDGRPLAGARILVIGAAYKPGVADVRESPAISIMDQLAGRGASIDYLDPLVPCLELSSGRQLQSIVPPGHGYDLVIVHGLQPGCDYRWVATQPRILDATYRFDAADHRVVV
jgi:UDP-N-acetyl-D-glucosamine dehydrogenase